MVTNVYLSIVTQNNHILLNDIKPPPTPPIIIILIIFSVCVPRFNAVFLHDGFSTDQAD